MVEKELDLERRNESDGPEAPPSGRRGVRRKRLWHRLWHLARALVGENGAYGGVW
jgi:hypothetical protein